MDADALVWLCVIAASGAGAGLLLASQRRARRLPSEGELEHRAQNDLFREGKDLVEQHIVLAGRRTNAQSARARGELRRGLALLRRVVTRSPESWPSYWLIGKAHQALEEHDEALDAFRRSHRLAPSHPDVAREYSLSCIRLGDAEEAVRAARRAAAARPDDAGLLANLALALLIAGEVDDALATVRAAHERDQADRITTNLLAFVDAVREGREPRPTRWPPR